MGFCENERYMTANAQKMDNLPPDPSLDQKGKSKLRGKKIAAYFLLPGIMPQIRELTRGGFGYLAFLIAYIYQAVRILPSNHPYTLPENFGKFGIRDVIAMAASHIKMTRENIDQIIIFFAILAGLGIMVLQFLAFLLMILTGEAFAQNVPDPNAAGGAGGLFATPNPEKDIAFHMLREVFGIPDMFGPLTNGPTSFHQALHALFNFYNLAILLVAVLVFLYYVIVVVAETAQTGVPFGKRFSHIYAPLRLVIAIGLLVPLNYGLNGAQYITLFSAKIGSGFATTGWSNFNESLVNPMGAESATLIAKPNMPDLTGFVEAMSVIVACREAYKLAQDLEIKPYFLDKKNNVIEMTGGAFEAVTQNNAGDVIVIFTQDLFSSEEKKSIRQAQNNDTSNSKTVYSKSYTDIETAPLCGKVVIHSTVPAMESIGASGTASPKEITRAYFIGLWFAWQLTPELKQLGQQISKAHHWDNNPCAGFAGNGSPDQGALQQLGACNTSYKLPESYKEKAVSQVTSYVMQAINRTYQNARSQVNFDMTQDIKDRGWGGAGIWYNKIAQVNGAYVTATVAPPDVQVWPAVAETVLQEKQKADSNFSGCDRFEPNLADNKAMQGPQGEVTRYYAAVINETYKYWRCDRKSSGGNFFWDTLNALFGLNGLFQIRDTIEVADGNNGETKEVSIHPLAKLSAVGKALVESAIRNLGMAMTASFGGGILGIISPHFQAAGQAFSGMFVSIATIGLSIGFILFYILPFMPFMYFFFAVGGWVKGIFEAMVGAPLWALAHMRIDGDGLPGQMAMNGYLLIFEIFLRPILTVFGLLAGMTIFTAMAVILNEIFDLAVENVTGGAVDISQRSLQNGDISFSRHIVDEFFFTVVYAVILYMMAMASFKMINMIPNSILRWLGQSVSTFNDNAGDPGAGLAQYTAIGVNQVGGQLASGLTQGSEAAGSLIQGMAKFGRGAQK